jgi:hypothetical protein
MAERQALRRGPFTFTRGRIIQVAVIVVLGVVGAVLPYLTLAYQDFSSQLIRPTHALFKAADMMGRLDLGYLPAADKVGQNALSPGVDVIHLGARAQQVGLIAAIVTSAALFMDEVNKFLWWGLHLSGWVLALGGIALLIGVNMLASTGTDVHAGIGWLPLALAGVVAIVFTFRSHKRLDTYRGL